MHENLLYRVEQKIAFSVPGPEPERYQVQPRVVKTFVANQIELGMLHTKIWNAFFGFSNDIGWRIFIQLRHKK